jgi:anti-anti-sigma regulatory factor
LQNRERPFGPFRAGRQGGDPLHCEDREGGMFVRLSEGDLARPVEVYSAFEDLIYERGERRITVDLSEIGMLTSLMIGTLVSIHLLAYENVVMLRFEGLHEKMIALLRMIGVDKLIEAHYAPPGAGAAANA